MPARRPRQERGRETRARIIDATARLVQERGPGATTIDAVLAASGTGKGQFYYYFPDKAALIDEVLAVELDGLLARQSSALENLDSWPGISAWFECLAEEFEGPEGSVPACPLGRLAAELAPTDERLRSKLASAFEEWGTHLARGLERMQDRGELSAAADAEHLALTVLAVLEGGVLLGRLRSDGSLVRSALAAAYALLRTYAVDPQAR